MRVLVWQWGRFGAGPRFAYEMARALREHCGCETLLSLAEGAELMKDPEVRSSVDIPVQTYEKTREFLLRSFKIPRVLAPLAEKLHDSRPDAAIVTMMGYWDIFLVRHLQHMGIPVVTVLHDAEVHPGDRFHLIVRLQRRIMRESDGVITLTDFVATQMKKHLSLAHKVHATIPLVAFSFSDLGLPAPVLPQATGDRPLRLLMAGRLKRYKGLNLLAEALARLDNVPLVLRVAGAPQNMHEMARLAALPAVEFDLGWQDDRGFISHLDWADACVLPYVEASQSGVAPMSFKRGRPVIATTVGGLPEQIRDGETGLLAEAGSAESLAATIKRLANDRVLLRRLSENALRHAHTEISWQALAPRYAKALEVVARSERPLKPVPAERSLC